MCPPPQGVLSQLPHHLGHRSLAWGGLRGKDCQGLGRGTSPRHREGGQWEQAGLESRTGSGSWEAGAPLKTVWGSASPQGHPGRRLGRLRLCLVQCVSACRGGDPGGVRVVAEGDFPAPKVPLSPFQLWGVPRGFLCMCTVAACRCLAGVRVAASPPSWGLYFVCVSVCLC